MLSFPQAQTCNQQQKQKEPINYLPWIHTSVTQIILCIIFLMLHRTTIKNMPSAVYISDTLVTLKHSQGNQAYNDNVDPRQGYNHVKFERFYFNGIWEKANVKGSFIQMRKYVNHLLWTYYVKIKKIVVNSWCAPCNQQSYEVST